MKLAMRECGTPEIIDIIDHDKYQSIGQRMMANDTFSHDYAESQAEQH